MTELQSFIEKLQGEMKEKISPVDLFNDELPSIGSVVSFLSDVISKLHHEISLHEFATEQKEIDFFKNVKPVFMSQYIFHKTIFKLRLSNSFALASTQKERIITAINKEQAFIKKNAEFYSYCMSGSSHLDEKYFVRNNNVAESITSDPRFSTSHDHKLSRFIAGELLKPVLFKRLHEMEHESFHAAPSLKWTASKTDLTELIYALQATGVFNDGHADLKQVADTFEAMFAIDLKDYYRLYQDIRVRKTSQKSFITRLKEHLQVKLDEKL